MPGSIEEARMRIRAIGEAFVTWKRPHESGIYPFVWVRVEEYSGESATIGERSVDRMSTGLPFAAEVAGTLISPYVVLILDAIFREMAGRNLAPDPSTVNTAISQAAAAFGAPSWLIEDLVKHTGPELCSTFQQLKSDSLSNVTPHDHSESPDAELDGVIVEWCDELLPEDCLGEVKVQSLSASSADERFVRHEDRYAIFVDERAQSVIARPFIVQTSVAVGSSVEVPWRKLARRHRVVLGVILQAFRKRRPIRYCDIMDDLDCGSYKPAQRAKSQLDIMLKGILSCVVRAVSNLDQYEVYRQIPYCWIRSVSGPSRLLR